MNIQLLLPFGLALVLSIILIPPVRRLSIRLGCLAQPRNDRWHLQPTPTLGGVGIFTAFGLSLVLSLLISRGWGDLQWGLLAGSVLIFGFGLIDDYRSLSPAAKLVGQIIAATVVISLGYTSTFFSPRIGNTVIAQLPNIVFTYIWLVGITNAINLLDNMDGLAGGISLITALILSYFFWRAGNMGLSWVSLALAGSVLGFLFYNFPVASIFMGDSGSQFLGFSLAVLAIAIAQQQQASNVLAVLAVPTLLFLLPILDTTLVTITRLMRGQSPVQGGRDHTSHRLIAFGLSERQALFVLYGIALVSGVTAAALESLNYWLSLALAPFMIVTLALIAAYLGRFKIVDSSSPTAHSRTISRIVLELTIRRRLLEVLLDFFLIGIAYYLAFLTHYGLTMDDSRLFIYLRSLPFALAGSYLAFFVAGVYRGVWRYVDFTDLVRYFQASVVSAALLAAVFFLLNSTGLAPWLENISPILILLFAVYLFIGLAASRSSFRILDLVIPKGGIGEVGENVIILGSGDEGEMAIRWILMKPALNYRLMGILVDDPLMLGRRIHGVEVLGGMEKLESILREGELNGVILAGINSRSSVGREIAETCRRYNCWLRVQRLEFEFIELD